MIIWKIVITNSVGFNQIWGNFHINRNDIQIKIQLKCEKINKSHVFVRRNLFCHHFTCTTLMKRELLKLSSMQQFPNDSNTIFASIISGASIVSGPHKNFTRCFVASVFPDPDSPPMMIDWNVFDIRKFLLTLSAVETARYKFENKNTINTFCPQYFFIVQCYLQNLTESKYMRWQRTHWSSLVLLNCF